MTRSSTDSLSRWIARHALVVWLGILLNLAFALPLLFAPEWLLDHFNVQLTQILWAHLTGLLFLVITVFYIPATIDLDRFRIYAWLAVFPSRSLGAVFFFLVVFVFGGPNAFIIGVLLDGSIALASLYCLIQIAKLEHAHLGLGEGL